MQHIVAWCAFFGSWLLVAGPIYQAVVELQEEEFEGDRIRATLRGLPAPEPISLWWWLLPPVRLYLQRRRSERQREQMRSALTTADLEALLHFKSKVVGWEYVALGGFLLALNETYALIDEYGWPIALFWVLVVVMAASCVGNAAISDARTKRALQQRVSDVAGT